MKKVSLAKLFKDSDKPMEQPKRSFESPWLMIMPALFVILVAFLYSILL